MFLVTGRDAKMQRVRRAIRAAFRAAACAMFCALLLPGCRSGPNNVALADPFTPSHNRNWQATHGVLPTAKIKGDRLHVQNIRNTYYFREHVCAPRYYDRTFDLRKLEGVDFVVVPFNETPSLAHTMLTFAFEDGEYLAVSVEARLEEGETYSPLRGSLRQYELMYVVADERDLIQLRTEHRDAEVYVYRTQVPPAEARALLEDIMQRVNQIAAQPEFYDTLTNNCTTNIVWHVNRVRPGRIPFDLGIVLTGHSDRLAYDLGLLDRSKPFEEVRSAARVNELARRYKDRSDFSELIRR